MASASSWPEPSRPAQTQQPHPPQADESTARLQAKRPPRTVYCSAGVDWDTKTSLLWKTCFFKPSRGPSRGRE